MGFSLSWLAVRGKPRDTVFAELGLAATGAREEIPESPLVATDLPGGWLVVVANNDTRFADEAVLARVSKGGETVSCFVEEHVMCSQASAWQDGAEVWFVGHESERGIDHLHTRGTLPAGAAQEQARLVAQQREAGPDDPDFVFDGPVDLAKSITGFRHDDDPPGGRADPFEVLTEAPAKRSWMKKLFG